MSNKLNSEIEYVNRILKYQILQNEFLGIAPLGYFLEFEHKFNLKNIFQKTRDGVKAWRILLAWITDELRNSFDEYAARLISRTD